MTFIVLADDRETTAPIVQLLKVSPDFEVRVTRLTLGDYLVDGRFLFERKTLPDLELAIVSGRLFTQALRLAATPLVPAIILEGTSRDIDGSGMTRESIQGALVTVTVFLGIPILRTRMPEETVRTMLFAARQANTIATGALPRHGYRPRGKLARQLFILQGLPGIGPSRARALLARFGSVEAAIKSSADDLRSIKGIGKRGAEKIRWVVEGSRGRYG